MRRPLSALVGLLVSASFTPSPAAERVALVIGNSRYEAEAALRNPHNDADAMERVLQALGFAVTKKSDLNLQEMEDTLVTFRRTLQKGGLGLFYYAGHGLQVKGENYLVPIGARLREEFEVKRQCLEVAQVLDVMTEAESNLKVVILDCCRDNPFHRSWRRSAAGKGLASIANVPEGTIVAFSTSPSLTAADGQGPNSPYTEQLVSVLQSRPTGGLELSEVFREASRAVKKQTGQVPWMNLEASLDKYWLWRQGSASALVPMPGPTPSTPSTPTPPSTPAPREVAAEFTVHLDENGPTIEGAQAELAYMATADGSPLILGRAPTNAAGMARVTTALTVAQQKLGSFKVVVSYAGVQKEWALPDFPQDVRYDLWVPGRPKAGSTFTNSIGMQLTLIPAGEFQMGSPDSDTQRDADESPVRLVRIARPFYLGTYEVTQAEYEQVMGTNPSSFSSQGAGSTLVTGQNTGRFPVENVTWRDAVDFCRRLSALPAERAAGRVYRLPTEAQWEYACRAGSRSRYFHGDDEQRLGEYAWYDGNAEERTHPVGEKRANKFGLYDTLGGVWEWCQDWMGPYGAESEVDPTGPASGYRRVVRGGSWHYDASFARSAIRRSDPPETQHYALGFRVSLAAPE